MSKFGHVPPAASDVQSPGFAVSVKIRGLPEHVQRIADALEIALPGAMEWHSCALVKANCLVEVNGTTSTLAN